MKILVINGSCRGGKGFTRFLSDLLLQGAAEAGARGEVVDLAHCRVNRCLSCGKCNTPAQYLKCVFEDQDDVKEIFRKMVEADILVFATPIYIFTLSGLLKIFLERMYARADVFDLRLTQSGLFFHHIDPALCSKPFVVLACCDNQEKETLKNVVSYFRTYARFNDARQVGLLLRGSGRFAGHGRDPAALKNIPRLPAVYEAFRRAGRELALNGKISRSTEKAAAQNILPIPAVFRLLGRFKPVKRKLIEQARRMTRLSAGDI
ncbi:MAG: flavodoxin family protein [Pseudomonadota bacterium]